MTEKRAAGHFELPANVAQRLGELLALPEVVNAAVMHYQREPLQQLSEALRAGQTIRIKGRVAEAA